MKWHVWHDGEGQLFVPAGSPHEPDGNPAARLLHVIEASSHNDAMRKYHEWMGWEPYKPMLDENGNEYPEDNAPQDDKTIPS